MTEVLRRLHHPGCDTPIPPVGVLPDQTQHEGTDGTHRRWPARPIRCGPGGVPSGDQVAVPAQDRVRVDQQPQPTQRLPRQAVQQRCEDGTSTADGERSPHAAAGLQGRHARRRVRGEQIRPTSAVSLFQRNRSSSSSRMPGGSSCSSALIVSSRPLHAPTVRNSFGPSGSLLSLTATTRSPP